MGDRIASAETALRSLLKHDGRLDGRAEVLVGLAGRGIQLSRSPIMHEREAHRLGLACRYVLIDFDALGLADADLPTVLEATRSLGFHGINVTHPFKQAVIPLLDRLSPEAAAIGAVNTVVHGPELVGHNTDCWGFAESFREGLGDVPLSRVAMFGAGGAGSAVGRALVELGVRDLAIVDTDEARANELASRIAATTDAKVSAQQDAEKAVRGADGVVNTTPIGMAKHPGTPFPAALLNSGQWVADIVYFPRETQLLQDACARGCKVLPGVGMAIGQAVRAFELFTGQTADMKEMADHFEAAA